MMVMAYVNNIADICINSSVCQLKYPSATTPTADYIQVNLYRSAMGLPHKSIASVPDRVTTQRDRKIHNTSIYLTGDVFGMMFVRCSGERKMSNTIRSASVVYLSDVHESSETLDLIEMEG